MEKPTPEDWKKWSLKQRFAWKKEHKKTTLDRVYSCLKCGYPTNKTKDGCESCCPERENE